MAELFGVDVRTINEHLQNIFKSNELDERSVILFGVNYPVRSDRIVDAEQRRDRLRRLKRKDKTGAKRKA